MTLAYEEDLAYIHDAGFGEFARSSAPGLLTMFQEARVTGGLVVDLGCGSGIWARELVDAGYEVLGVDISAAMIALARRRLPAARFQTGSFRKVKLPRCVAVTALGEVLSYCFDARNSRQALGRLFERVHVALKPGGLFVFDVAIVGRNSKLRQQFWEGDDWTVLVEFEHDAKRKRLTRRIVSFRRVGKTYRRHEETHRLQLFDRSEITTRLREAGFRVRTLRGYGKSRFPDGLVGFLARKP